MGDKGRTQGHSGVSTARPDPTKGLEGPGGSEGAAGCGCWATPVRGGQAIVRALGGGRHQMAACGCSGLGQGEGM